MKSLSGPSSERCSDRHIVMVRRSAFAPTFATIDPKYSQHSNDHDQVERTGEYPTSSTTTAESCNT